MAVALTAAGQRLRLPRGLIDVGDLARYAQSRMPVIARKIVTSFKLRQPQ